MVVLPPVAPTSAHDILFSHLVEIRSALWRSSSAGRASVMIGAGFSRQAKSLAVTGARLPLWSDLRRRLAERLRLRADDNATVPEVAQIFQERFGRAALDDAITDFIPDLAFGPGDAHRRLLALPWSDIFTTNYDTLLERAAVNTFERRYETILVPQDLPQRASPRIVKLHGSLPSHRPFIISTTDYGDYAEDRAPFINLVRQSAMETVLVLLGFSGTDPNFSEWMSWVQDELGKQALPIYLCGIFEFTPEKIQELAKKRIIVLNFSDLFPRKDFPQRDERHAAATAWFLDVLLDGKPAKPVEWAPDQPAIQHALKPPGPAPFRFTPFHGSIPNPQSPPTGEQLIEIAKIWERQRGEYPGWIVAPNRPRWRVWHSTKRLRSYMVDACGSLSLSEQFRLLRELFWRVELCLASVWTPEARVIAALLERCNPFPGILNMPGASNHLSGINDTEFAKGWIELALVVLRVAREDLEENVYQLWFGRLNLLLPVWPDLGSRFWAEQVYWALARLDLDQLDESLRQWEAKDRTLLGRSKIVAIKGELGRPDAAFALAEDVLKELRAQLGTLHSPIVLLSLESWLINLMEVVKESPWYKPPDVRERLAELRRADCDPDEIITDLKSDLRNFEQPANDRADGPEFDPGFDDETGSPSYWEDSDLLPAFRVLHLVEVAPCAWHSHRFAFLSHEAAAAAVWLQNTAPFLALSVIVRTGDKKAVSHFMDRASVAMLPAAHVDRIWMMLQRLATHVLTRIPATIQEAGTNSVCRMGSTGLDLASRLAFRFRPDQLDQLLDLIARWLQSTSAARAWVFDGAMRTLLERTIFVLPPDKLPTAAVRFLCSPIIEDRGEGEIHRGHWPEVAECMLERDDWPDAAPKFPPGFIDRLIHHARSDDGEGRHRAAFRMLFLRERNWLTPEELQACSAAIWSRVDAGNGMPRYLRFTAEGMAALPGAEEHGLVAKRLNRLTSGAFRPIRGPDGKSMELGTLSELNRELQEIRRNYAIFNPEPPKSILDGQTARRILDGIARWWQSNATVLREIADGRRGQLLSPASAAIVGNRFVQIVGECVLPALKEDPAGLEAATAWLAIAAESGFDATLADVGLLVVGVCDADSVAKRISRLLLAHTKREINDGSWLILTWLRAHQKKLTSVGPPQCLADQLVLRVAWRTEPGLASSCDWLAIVIDEFGEIFTADARSLLLVSLDVMLATTDFELAARKERGQIAARREAHRLMSIRTSATAVASALHRAAVKQGLSPEPVLEKWHSLAAKNILPEIRQAWKSFPS
jgi:hypothetical protein